MSGPLPQPQPPAIHPGAVYGPRLPADQLPADLKLRSIEWGVLFALTGRHSVAQVAAQLGMPPGQVAAVFRALIARKLIVEQPLSLPEYLRGVATSGDPVPKTFAELLRTAPLAPTAAAVRVPASSAAPPKAVATSSAPPRPAAPPPAFRPLALEDPTMTQPSSRALSLKALMSFIRGRSQDETAGQLDVYRAFLRVDPELLKRHGITTLRFEDDRVIRDAELQERILHSVESTLGVQCPPEVFV